MENIQELINQEYSKILKAKNYLNDTDYKLLRELDGGEPMDSETKIKRYKARAEINESESIISKLEKELNEFRLEKELNELWQY